MRLIFILLIISPLISFSQSIEGLWRCEVPTTMGALPFHILIEKQGKTLKAFAKNADEKLPLDDLQLKGDTIIIKMDIFDAVIKVRQKNNTLRGSFTKRLANLSYRTVPLLAQKGDQTRFKTQENTTKHNVSGSYEVNFDDAGNAYPAVGIFTQNQTNVKGTFLTKTGDYRFLQGNIIGDSLKLSCFDGNHIFLFKAKIVGDKLEGGYFGYNMLGHETWQGFKNPAAKLPDAYSLTYLKPGFDKLAFSFKNIDGQILSLDDKQFENKVTIVQIMGSWCPNCMDETRYLSSFYKKNKQIAIVGLAFEKSETEDFAFPKIKKLKERFGVEYPVLLAGKNDKADASAKLPMLNKIISFPTTIIIDKKGKVRKIHTGFTGPATGVYYDKFVNEFEAFVKLLNEES